MREGRVNLINQGGASLRFPHTAAQAAILRFHQVAAGFQLPLAEQLLSRTSNSQLKTRPTLTNLTAVAHIICHWYKFCGTDASLAVFTNIFALAGRV